MTDIKTEKLTSGSLTITVTSDSNSVDADDQPGQAEQVFTKLSSEDEAKEMTMHCLRQLPTWQSYIDLSQIMYYSDVIKTESYFHWLFAEYREWLKTPNLSTYINTSEIDFVRWCWAFGYGDAIQDRITRIYRNLAVKQPDSTSQVLV
jgi:hypothetical protein